MLFHGIAKNTGEFNFMELNEDEYIGEEVSALYDQKYNIIMLQRNRNSLSPSGIEKYFSGVLNNGDTIELVAIPAPDELKIIKQNQIFRKLSIGFSPTIIDDEILNNVNKPLIQIIKGSRDLGALKVSIVLSLGNSKKKKTLKQEEIIELENLQNYDGFNKIQVSRREDEDTQVETIDLLSGKLNDVITMEVSKINPIKYERLIIEMQNLYNAKNELIKKLFGEE